MAIESILLSQLIRAGDRVTIRTPHGGTRTGRAVIPSRTHCALNLGGPHGTPGVADDRNIERITRRVNGRTVVVFPTNPVIGGPI